MPDSTGQAYLSPSHGAATVRRQRGRRAGPVPDAWETGHFCKRCTTGEMARIHRESFFEFVISWFGFFPFACASCFERGYRLKFRRLLFSAVFSAIACLSLAASVLVLHSQYVAKVRQQRRDAMARERMYLKTPAVSQTHTPEKSKSGPDSTN
jgi:hypothetical protein